MNFANARRVGAFLPLALAVAGCSSHTWLPREADVNAASFQSYEQIEAAFAKVTPNATTVAELDKLGFDAKTVPNVELLTYVGIGARFQPRGTDTPTSLPAQVQACVDTQDRCRAAVFHLRHIESRHVGNTLLDLTGFERRVVDTGWTADVMVVIEDGVVIYKIMSGQPHIVDARDTVQPLGPLQSLSAPVSPPPQH